MKKLFGILIAIMFASTTSVLASEPLTDTELDNIDAGSWIVVEQEGYKEVHEVYKNSNSILIEDEAQKDIQAVANTNAVDSAVAVQTNISSATGDAISNDIEGHNTANIINYNPSDYGKTWSGTTNKTHTTSDTSSSANSLSSSSDVWSGWSGASAGKGYDYDETLDINFAAAAAGVERGKHYSGQTYAAAEVFNLDYDKTIDANEEWSAQSHETGLWDSLSQSANSSSANLDSWTENSSDSGSETRSNHGEWNSLLLVETSQTNLQVVSNLNSVGSGAAVQSNIASNVGVGGSIKHSSTATVINGL